LKIPKACGGFHRRRTGNFIQNIHCAGWHDAEIGHAAAFLSSPLAAYVTGTSLWSMADRHYPGRVLQQHSAAFLASGAGHESSIFDIDRNQFGMNTITGSDSNVSRQSCEARAVSRPLSWAQSGETVTYAELEERTNRLAHFLRNRPETSRSLFDLHGDNARYIECCGAGERSGLYFTCINSFLTPDELAYIVNNSESKA